MSFKVVNDAISILAIAWQLIGFVFWLKHAFKIAQ